MKRKSVLYQEVAEKLKEDILTGKYPLGSLLPTELELEEMFQVSKITVRKAIELLAADDYVEKKSGRGTTVLSNRPYNKLSKATTFTQLLENSGQHVYKETLSYQACKLAKNHPAYTLMGEDIYLLRRLYYLESQPYIYYEYYFPQLLADMQTTDFEEKSLYRILDEHHLFIDKFRDSFQPVQLQQTQQELLKTTEQTALKRVRCSYDQKGSVVEYSEGIYNSALYPYVIEFEA